MRAGKLDRRLVILAPNDVGGKTGAPRMTYTPIDTVPCSYFPQTGKERDDAGTVNVTYDAGFSIRYRADVTYKHRVEFEGQEFDIISLRPYPRRGSLQILGKVRLG